MKATISTRIAAGSRQQMAKKPASLVGMEPTTDIESYDAVPWFRKQWFVFFPLFLPAMVALALTGDVYAKANKTMKKYSEANVWRYTTGGRTFIIANGLIVAAVVSISILS